MRQNSFKIMKMKIMGLTVMIEMTELKVVEDEPQLLINSTFYALQDVIHVKATDGVNEPQSEE